jgi:hypothetical protein
MMGSSLAGAAGQAWQPRHSRPPAPKRGTRRNRPMRSAIIGHENARFEWALFHSAGRIV